MKKQIIGILVAALLILTNSLKADEGMWIPMLLKKYNIEDMQKKGFKLSAEDIYSVNNSSMKDAVMIFGGGCTGELISDQGLLITNHHCGYGFIQKHSSLENDYLTDGFWAMSKEEELTNNGLEVKFLKKMEDVTDKVLANVDDEMSVSKRQSTIDKNIADIKNNIDISDFEEIVIKPFYKGNQYFMYINKIYKDVRLVGAPPSSIGKFGGDTDNWMWPRHTGDFSLFRIYTAPDGSPAKYSEENIPMKPNKHFPVSLKGYKKGDFTMVFGYPGSTDQYAPSFELEMTKNVINPLRIGIRGEIIDKMKAEMEKDKLVRIQYASKAAGLSNGWKKWIGENNGLERMNAIQRKKDFEAEFNKWAKGTKYENIIGEYRKIYESLEEYEKAGTAVIELLYGIELLKLSSSGNGLVRAVNKEMEDEIIKNQLQTVKKKTNNFYEDYDRATAKAVTAEAINYYINNIDKKWWTEMLTEAKDEQADEIAEEMFEESIFANKDDMKEYLEDFNNKVKDIEKDPFYNLYQELVNMYRNDIAPARNKYSAVLDSLDRHYMAAQMDFQNDKLFYPDANFTLRVAYGQVDTYYPKDAVKYKYYTTMKGIMEKDNPEVYDYDVPEKLKTLYNEKDFGKYASDKGDMNVCFIASNHTSGGNSGSPVVNSEGHLIGVNFDRNWEGTMSDLMYDPDMCRNISIDIRYALFIIDKFAGATHLVNEMTLRK